ncbi:Cytochrome b5-like heme/steroid binding domain [Dillenia turbinata]|uniref:Cytochrome b5-like heme/steroid binding domain n=1 Tax=Dillenia turbinata TaxID=194707 RepID=A0AAN8UVE0_9MAGN
MVKRSPFVLIAVSIPLIAILYTRFLHRSHPLPSLFTVEQLSLYNGTDDTLPILLAILGSVFDVTKGKSHYGVGGGYNHFSGRDASRAFVSGNFTGEDGHGTEACEEILTKSSLLQLFFDFQLISSNHMNNSENTPGIYCMHKEKLWRKLEIIDARQKYVSEDNWF